MNQNWDLLAMKVRRRRAELGLRQRDIKSRGGPNHDTLSRIEQASRTNYAYSTMRRLEEALEWPDGFVDTILTTRDHVDETSTGTLLPSRTREDYDMPSYLAGFVNGYWEGYDFRDSRGDTGEMEEVADSGDPGVAHAASATTPLDLGTPPQAGPPQAQDGFVASALRAFRRPSSGGRAS